MTNNTQHPDNGEERSNDHQHAVEACKHAVDALVTDDLARAHALLDEACRAVERAQHDDTATQEQREIAFDCYD